MINIGLISVQIQRLKFLNKQNLIKNLIKKIKGLENKLKC